jgi:hypothetical protein
MALWSIEKNRVTSANWCVLMILAMKSEHVKNKLKIERVCTTFVQSQSTVRRKQVCHHRKSHNLISESQVWVVRCSCYCLMYHLIAFWRSCSERFWSSIWNGNVLLMTKECWFSCISWPPNIHTLDCTIFICCFKFSSERFSNWYTRTQNDYWFLTCSHLISYSIVNENPPFRKFSALNDFSSSSSNTIPLTGWLMTL